MITSAPVALIYRAQLLPPSETFIKSQAAFMKTFRPFFVGRSRVPGIELPGDSLWVANHGGQMGRLQQLRFRILGPGAECRNRMRALQPKIVHGHFGPDACEAIPLASGLNIPLMVTFHGFDATLTDSAFRETRPGRRYLRRRETLKREASGFIAVSNFIAKKIVGQGFPREKIRVHYIGVDTSQFQPDPTVARGKTVLFVGRLVEVKGCEYLIRAMEPIQKEMPDVELVIVGDGPLRESLQQLAKSLLRRFTFAGAQPAENIRDWMTRASVLCTPSVVATSGAEEGFGMVFIEAQSSGLPVVSFSSGGIPEAVRHGESGYLAPEKDWRVLSEYISKLLGNQDLWASFSRAGRELVKSVFDLKVQTVKLERIYEEVIDSHSHRNKHPESS
jgi:colanic acid/amylovoran biosynthesis glycosyltransferase